MDVTRLNSGTDPVYRLFREYAEGECVYRRLERAEFEERFFAPLEGYEKVFLCAENAGAAAGIAASPIGQILVEKYIAGWEEIEFEAMRDAQAHPERHQQLVVRLWGWSASFVELDKEFQDHVMQRQQYEL